MDQPVLANLRGAALIAGLSLGAVSPPELRSLVPVAETHLPEPGAVAVYDRLSVELPALYKAQKGMFARLAR